MQGIPPQAAQRLKNILAQVVRLNLRKR